MKIYAKPSARVVLLKKGYTIISLSNEISLSLQGLRQVMSRSNGISPEKAREISEFLKVEFDEIFEIV